MPWGRRPEELLQEVSVTQMGESSSRGHTGGGLGWALPLSWPLQSLGVGSFLSNHPAPLGNKDLTFCFGA